MHETEARKWLRMTSHKSRHRGPHNPEFQISGSDIRAALFHDHSAVIWEHVSGLELEVYNLADTQQLVSWYWQAKEECLASYHPKSHQWYSHHPEVVG